MSDFDTLADRIRSEAALADRPGQMERLEGIAEEVDRLRRGARTLGETIEQQCRMVLDATGLHHFIDEDGDGDWGAVWDNLYDIRAKAFDEGKMAAYSAERDGLDGSEVRNPYATPAHHERGDQRGEVS